MSFRLLGIYILLDSNLSFFGNAVHCQEPRFPEKEEKAWSQPIALHIQSLFQGFYVPILLPMRSKKSKRAYTV